MAEKTTPEANALARRYQREVARAAAKTYGRLVREFMRDGECEEADARKWLASVGINSPEPTKK
jgi:hypothetical protein